ncbi:MAG TPA: DUF4369 domain-containing protein [Rhizobacter sp.]|nr:DUF4369 domain-containing protein [Rhizobacter sp.]
MSRRLVAVSSLLLTLGLAACLAAGSASVGGTLSGLPTSTTVVLQNNGGDNLTLSQNGSFTFSGTLDNGKTYAVTVLTQPAGAVCTVGNGNGTIDSNGTDVTNVSVTCAVSTSLSGTVSGLNPGTSVTLINGTTTLAVATNGAFAFPGTLANGTAYAVTVSIPPAGQTCTVANGSGTFTSGTATNIAVTCV